MTNVSAGLMGALAGLILAALGNLIVLPVVLKVQERVFSADYRHPFLGDRQAVRRVTKLMYRVMIPIVFSIVGAITAVHMYGGSE